MNNAGTVVSFYQYNISGDFSAFQDMAGTITSFQFPGSISTQALGINDLGDIVGDYTLGGEMFGFLDDGGVFSTLDPFGSTMATANGINDVGGADNIVGFYTNAAGSTIGFEATATPEPGALILLATVLAGLAWVRRRRRASA